MIEDVIALPIYDSRGEPTLKVWLKTGKGFYEGSSPTGRSVGKWEAKTLNINKSMAVFKKVRKDIIGLREQDYKIIDDLLEHTGGKEFSKIGSVLSLSISIACIRVAADNKVYKFLNPDAKKFPFPIGNVIGGGVHLGHTSIQEYLVIPFKAKTIREAIETNFSIWKDVGKHLKIKGFNAGRNDEGAWIARMDDNKTLDFLSNICEDYEAKIGVDFASTQIFKGGKYNYLHLGKKYNPGEQLDFVEHLVKRYKLAYVEDPFHENDFSSFSELKRKVGCMVVGDDLFATQPSRLGEGSKRGSGNSIIIKPNQAGTISKTLETVKLAKDVGYSTIVSHRSGETTDAIISDLAVATESPLIKCGVCGGERVAKLNRLLEIWNGIRKPEMTKFKIK